MKVPIPKGQSVVGMRDNTLLSRLGFGDLDKGNQLHDLACQYLAQKPILQALADRYLFPEEWRKRLDVHSPPDNPLVSWCEFEKTVSKGEDKYKTTIGFIDLIARLCRRDTNGKYYSGFRFYFEVKIHPVSCGDLLRQIKLYREYLDDPYPFLWFVAVAFPLSEMDVKTLASEHIMPIALGDKFKEFVAGLGSNQALVHEV